MIVVDTSALMTILLDEPEAGACMTALATQPHVLISAGTVAEALIVAARRKVRDEMVEIISGLGFDVVSVTASSARLVADAYQQWGKGPHAAGLNFGDCFAYQLAKERNCALLYTGSDFSKTDLKAVVNN